MGSMFSNLQWIIFAQWLQVSIPTLQIFFLIIANEYFLSELEGTMECDLSPDFSVTSLVPQVQKSAFSQSLDASTIVNGILGVSSPSYGLFYQVCLRLFSCLFFVSFICFCYFSFVGYFLACGFWSTKCFYFHFYFNIQIKGSCLTLLKETKLKILLKQVTCIFILVL